MPKYKTQLAPDVLANPLRRQILEHIRSNPGATRWVLQQKVVPSSGTLDWHLAKLRKAGYIRLAGESPASFRAVPDRSRAIFSGMDSDWSGHYRLKGSAQKAGA